MGQNQQISNDHAINNDQKKTYERDEIVNIGKELFKKSSKQAENLEDATRLLGKIIDNIGISNHRANQVLGMASQSRKTMDLNRNQIDSLKDLFGVIKKFYISFGKVGNLINEIEDRLKFVNRIALKSEKLSYNAEIEAARSGEESGRFSVIAEEIRNMTKMNRKAAADISQIVNKAVASVEEYSNEIKHSLETGNKIVNNVENLYENITSEIGDMFNETQLISDMSIKQLNDSKEVSEHVKTEIEAHSHLMSEMLGDFLGNRIMDIDPKEAAKRIAEFILIDVRGAEEYFDQLGHIEHSINLPISGDLEKMLESFEPDKKYLFICRSGGRSARACRIAQGLGFGFVYNLKGGMLSWNETRLPVISGSEKNKK